MFTTTKSRWLAIGITGIVLLGGGTALGSTVNDPTSSAEYAALQSAKASAESDRDGLQTDYDELSDGIDAREADVVSRQADLKKAETALAKREKAVGKREKSVTGAEKEKAANTIGEGTWTVGTDIAPGTYRATEPVGSTCYWGIYATGSNGDDIIANDLPGGGRPSVTLATGQDFNTTRCGSWEKQ